MSTHAQTLGNRAEVDPTTLSELLDNVIRTARQHRWEDAAARLYRVIEMPARIRLCDGTEARNASILAHGCASIGEDGHNRLKSAARDFLNFPIDAEVHPIPKLDHAWLAYIPQSIDSLPGRQAKRPEKRHLPTCCVTSSMTR